MIATVTALATQATVLGDWLMPAGAAIGAATALLIRSRRARHTSATQRRATTHDDDVTKPPRAGVRG